MWVKTAKKSCKVLKILLIAFNLLLFCGCATQTKYVKCSYKSDIVRPIKQDYENYQEYLKAIFQYTYELEAFKSFCE